MKLYEIDLAIDKILHDCVDENGEIHPDAEALLDGLEMDREEKIKNVGKAILGHRLAAEGILKVAKQLTARAKQHNAQARWLEEEYLGESIPDEKGAMHEWPELTVKRSISFRVEPEFVDADGATDYEHIDQAYRELFINPTVHFDPKKP